MQRTGSPRSRCRHIVYCGAFGKGTGPVWMSDLNCQGHEESLWECSWPRIAGIYWDHDNDAGVVCRPFSGSFTNAPSTEKSSLISALEIGLPVAAGVIILLLVFAFYFRCYRRDRGEYDPRRELVHMGEVSPVSPSTDTGQINPAFQKSKFSYPDQLDSESNNETDWCEISRERLTFGERIGTECDGVTFHGKLCRENGNIENCIVKTIKDSNNEESGSSDDQNDLLTEIKILNSLGSHPNILNFFGACTLKGPTYLIFEEAEHGNLLDYLQQNQKNDETNYSQKVCTLSKVEKLRIALDVSKGMKHIAERKCIHKDLAARSIRLGKNSVAKVTNIGSSRDIYDRTFYEDISTGKLSAAKWMAPETLESMNFSSESDVWSFGILLWEMETGGDVPYPEIEAKDLLQSLKSGHRMDKPAMSSDVIYEVMTKCWQSSANERPKFSELCMVLDTLVTRETTC
ncbi:hypothetical protein OS493_036508 [Desmophyllum pertusum]|uniref:Uncharacterized protein n=1 Tax=Desmophyllum pertusum TaxID=174260 RepID=A0A9W9ZWX2_9CNID|nr:hypothetical protein OS493_036508 [Desmophyllum pertusum]